ncbi:MAG: prepilin-type N-terminal cleavage/methylation domain-containing protein [Pseudomonadota bacterium]
MHIPSSAYQTKGFTLLELLITIAIIGILSSVAIPSYQTYIIKAKYSEAFVFMSKYKKDVELYFAQHNKLPANAKVLGLNSVQTGSFGASTHQNSYSEINPNQFSNSKYIKSIAIGYHQQTRTNGSIWFRSNLNASSTYDKDQLYVSAFLVPTASNGALTWKCQPSGLTIRYNHTKYLPSICQ